MAAPSEQLATPLSILDTDLYKFTMQQAVLQHFPDVQATYTFTNRDKNILFSRHCVERFRTAVSFFTDLSLTREEHSWLSNACPFLTEDYLSYLSSFRFKPEQVRITYHPVSQDGLMGNLEIVATGPWVETILWEVPLMATLSETYFQIVATDWDYDGQEELAYAKAKSLLEAGCSFSEFGTRRRRSYHAHDIVLANLVRASKEVSSQAFLSGTSNVHFAQKYGLKPIGTIAHEWFMGVAALKGYEHANSIALDLWESVYPVGKTDLIALTDTFSTAGFFKDFVEDPERAQRWTGLRQDSGDPFSFGPRVFQMYTDLGINPSTKLIVYSDSLNIEKAIQLRQQCKELGLNKVSFGIGTFLTNDFRTTSSGGVDKSKALNMVIKLSSVDSKPCVKISDDLTKNTGDKATVEQVKRMYNLPV